MTDEQRQRIISAFWQGFAAGISTSAIPSPPAEYLDAIDETWTAQDVANNVRVTVDGMPLVKLGDWLLSVDCMSNLILSAKLGTESYELTLWAAVAETGYNVSVWSVADMELVLLSCQVAVMGVPEPGTYFVDVWSMDGLADCEVSAKMNPNVITWNGEIGDLETVSTSYGTYVKVSDTVPSTDLSTYTSVTIVSNGELTVYDISDEGEHSTFKTVTDDSYITLALLFARVVYVDSVEISGGVFTKGVWFLKADETSYTQKITGNFSDE